MGAIIGASPPRAIPASTTMRRATAYEPSEPGAEDDVSTSAAAGSMLSGGDARTGRNDHLRFDRMGSGRGDRYDMRSWGVQSAGRLEFYAHDALPSWHK